MKPKPKIFVVSQRGYLRPFVDLFDEVNVLEKADVAMFTGGEDVTPELYGQNLGSRTGSNWKRDQHEADVFARCEDLGIMKLGICRGSQFLTVMSGGSLIQDVTNHVGSHEVFTEDGKTLIVSSTHHQMMNPFRPREPSGRLPTFELLAWSEGRSQHYLDGEDEDDRVFATHQVEPEIVWYPDTHALAIQCHPEIMNITSKGVQHCRQLVSRYLT